MFTLDLRILLVLALTPCMRGQLGEPTGEEFDAQAVTTAALGGTWDGVQGVVRTLSGSYWVSARRSAPSPSLRLIEFDSDGTYLANVTLPAALSGSVTGLLDLAYDSVGGVIYGGCEYAVAGRQLWAFRLATRTFDATSNVAVPASAPGSAARGLCYDRFGDNAQGTFFCVDGAGAITEFDRSGNLVRSLANPHPNATALALDDTYRILWVFGPGGSSKTGEGVVGIAVDVQTGQPNGQKVLGDSHYAGTPAGGNVTGAEFATYAHDHTVYRLSLATNAASDWIYELEGRFRYGTQCGGTIGFRGDAAYAGNVAWQVTLQGSAAASAFLMLSAGRTSTPIAGPLFAAGCSIHLGLAPAPLALGGVAVVSGAGQLSVPIPAGITGSISFQWIEAPLSGLPLRSSDGGRAFLRL